MSGDDISRPVAVITPDLRPGTIPLLEGLHDAELLHRLITTLAFGGPGTWSGRVGSVLAATPARRAIWRRSLPPSLAGRARSYPARECVRVIGSRLLRNDILGDHLWWWAERGFDRRVARAWAGRVPVLYGFELASSDTFGAQKRCGGRTILGQLIAHHCTVYSLLREELAHHPEMFSAYERRGLDTADRVNALKDRQYENSDLIIANSEFVRDSFLAAGFPAARIAVVPGAAPRVSAIGPTRDRTRPPTFLSAGMLSVRKGTHYLLDAWRTVHHEANARLILAGRNLLPEAATADLPPSVSVLGQVSPAELDRLYQTASCLVLPSLCEGFALVILEAMARGLPVITTPNSGCGDFVVDGENGWIVPIRDSGRLAERLIWAAHHPEELCVMGERSQARAAAWTWDDYASAHADIVRRFVRAEQ